MSRRKKRQNDFYDGRLTEEAVELDCFLKRYAVAVRTKRILERRRRRITKELGYYRVKSPGLDGMPRGNGNGREEMAVAIVYRLDEIDTRIREQIERATIRMAEIMNVIDFLHENTEERAIIENRYIDMMEWEDICRENYISRSSAIRRWKKALHVLLKQERVKKILNDYQNGLRK